MTSAIITNAASEITDGGLVSLWSSGFDTVEIARCVGTSEAAVANQLSRILDRRHGGAELLSRETSSSQSPQPLAGS